MAKVGFEDEVLQRVRRIETRMTKCFQALGVDTGAVMPKWTATGFHGWIEAPSDKVTLAQILDVMPDGVHVANVVCKGEIIAEIKR